MFARSRTQLRLLLFAMVATVALAIPAGAHAAAVLDLTADGDPIAIQPDGGEAFTGGEDLADYNFTIFNTSLTDDSVDATFTATFQTDELQFEDYQDTNGGDASSCSSQEIADETVVTCDISVPADDNTGVSFYASTAFGFTPTSTTIDFAITDDGVTADTMSDTSSWDYLPTCANQGYFYDSSFTRAELQTNGTLSIPITCTDPDGGALSITPKPGTYGTVTGSGTSATFTASPATLASPTGFFEFYELVLTDNEGDTTTANLQVAVYTQSNTKSTISGPTSIAVPAEGSTVTYTNTVLNNGPDAIGRIGFGWEISDKATLVSATAGGTAVTCEPAQYGDPGLVAWGCGTAAMPAVGSSVAGTLTIRYKAGEKGLTIPSSALVTAIAGPDSMSGAEDRSYGDNESAITTSLTTYVAPANPTQGTSGNDSYVGTSGNDTYSGGAGNDTFAGGAGNDTFFGETGDDVFDGGAGDDRFYGGTGDDSGFGGSGNDLLFGGLGNDRLVGGDGSDKLYGQDGADRLLGSTGGDIVNGGPGNDIVRGGTGADRVYCGSGTDVATGDNGMDLIGCRDGKAGDTLSGGFGLDVCVGDVGDRFLSCETIFRLA